MNARPPAGQLLCRTGVSLKLSMSSSFSPDLSGSGEKDLMLLKGASDVQKA